jgi:hypothetical protein
MREYLTHFNGDRPFLVKDFGDRVEVYDNKGDKGLLLKSPYKKIFVGKEPTGNTVLIQVTNSKYIHAGSIAYSFSLVKGDSIKSFHSPVSKWDIPRPYAIGKTHTYLLLDEVAIPNELLNFKEDIYIQWYFGSWVKGCATTMTPWCRSELKNTVSATRKYRIQEKRKTLKVKKLKN